MVTLHQHGLNRSLILHLRDKLGEDFRISLHSDGLTLPEERPLILIEQMQSNSEILTKQREAIETIYRYQIGLFDVNSAQLSINQERLQRIFNFDEIPFYDTLQSPHKMTGYFLCNLTAVTPMPASDISKRSEYNRVYFDVEINDIKRRW